jgi:hypothetical protein
MQIGAFSWEDNDNRPTIALTNFIGRYSVDTTSKKEVGRDRCDRLVDNSYLHSYLTRKASIGMLIWPYNFLVDQRKSFKSFVVYVNQSASFGIWPPCPRICSVHPPL